MESESPWIVIRKDKDPKTLHLECLRCGGTIVATLPMPVSSVLLCSDAMTSAHKRCYHPAEKGEEE